MNIPKSLRTLRWQLTKSDLVVGPGLKQAIRDAIAALEEKQTREKGVEK